MKTFGPALRLRHQLPYWLAAILGLVALVGCEKSRPQPVTLTFLDPEWSHDMRQRSQLSDAALREFTQQTGIAVTHLPAPESSSSQLALARELLSKGPSGADVYGIDVIWPGILKEDLVDLRPYFASQVLSEDPRLIANYTVDGKLVAMPYHANVGTLFYRKDLLQKYGYKEPPRTWDQLEQMAAAIQAGERAKGATDFWGFVWPGAAGEGLTCNALEWQVGEGGGQIIEANKTISVNNPNAIRSWERAARWVGRISPPGVTSYQEWDAINAFWSSGRAAFLRNWNSDYFLIHPADWRFIRLAGVTSVPATKADRVSTLGGFGLAISRSSPHRTEAVELVRFLLRREAETSAAGAQAEPTAGENELFELPAILTSYSRFRKSGGKPGGNVVTRPSSVTGNDYEKVSQAYAAAVHSVLTRKTTAPEAAAALEKELAGITGFKTGPAQ